MSNVLEILKNLVLISSGREQSYSEGDLVKRQCFSVCLCTCILHNRSPAGGNRLQTVFVDLSCVEHEMAASSNDKFTHLQCSAPF